MDGLICQLEAGYRGMIQLYQELSNLAASVGKSLAAGDWKEVDALLAKKQGIMQVIDSREAELSRLREELQDRLGVEKFSLAHLPQSPAAAQLNDTLDELRDIIDELQAREKTNEEQLRKLVQAVQAQLRDFGRSRKAAKAYTGPTDIGESRFIDRKK
ncbi:MAG: flagellar protein FlgN [Firmicutes bacterium]|jgi:uncharacterized membrane protein YccC|nr:flagellar protein FlgN [Bacillota bacterium]